MKRDKTLGGGASGFTLVEMAIVLMLVGLIISSFIPGLKTYKTSRDFNTTRDHMELTQEVLREFYGLNGRYPCPANPNLPETDANYGLESCRATVAAACPIGIICTNVGSRDADNADGDNDPTTGRDPVTIGAIPSRTLADSALFAEFQIANGHDGFLMKFSYAVSELMTDQTLTISNPANGQLGAVALKDEFNQDLLNPPDSAHYVFFSHGDNTRGAFTLEGGNVGDCTVMAMGVPVPPPAGSNIGAAGIEIDKENCDGNDAIFVKALRSLGNNDSYFDDMVFFNAITSNSLWRRSNFSPPTDAYLYNTNVGEVGIGLTNPASKLHVNGDIRTESSVIADGDYCALDASDCLAPEALGGTAMTQCPPGEIATGIENNDLVCIPLFAGPINFTCPFAGEFVTSFTNLGSVTCSPVP